MPFETSMQALEEMCRVARKAVVISLPDVETCWPSTVKIPRLGEIKFIIPQPFFSPRQHIFDGEHHWENNKTGDSLKRLASEIDRKLTGLNPSPKCARSMPS